MPECFNTPYATNYFAGYSEPVPSGPTCKRLAALAKELNIYFVAGSIPEKDGDKVYNCATVWSPEGKLLGKHRKVNALLKFGNLCQDVALRFNFVSKRAFHYRFTCTIPPLWAILFSLNQMVSHLEATSRSSKWTGIKSGLVFATICDLMNSAVHTVTKVKLRYVFSF